MSPDNAVSEVEGSMRVVNREQAISEVLLSANLTAQTSLKKADFPLLLTSNC